MFVHDERHLTQLTFLGSQILHKQASALSTHGGLGGTAGTAQQDGDAVIAVGHADTKEIRLLPIQLLRGRNEVKTVVRLRRVAVGGLHGNDGSRNLKLETRNWRTHDFLGLLVRSEAERPSLRCYMQGKQRCNGKHKETIHGQTIHST